MKWIKRILIGLLVLFIVLSIIPYLIPVKIYNKYTEELFKESEYKEIEGIDIHYRKWIPEDSSIRGKVLMVHGFGGSTFSWRNNVKTLQQEGYIVVLADLPGFGYSDKAKNIDHSQKNRSALLWSLLEDIDRNLNQTISEKDWILVGHSMGGGTIAAMAMENPEKTSKLVMVSGALFDNNPPSVSKFSKVLYYPPIRRLIDVVFSNYLITYDRIENFLSSAYGRSVTPIEVEGYLNPLELNSTPSFIVDLLTTTKSEPIERLKDSSIPILYIRGENDTWVPKEQALEFKQLVNQVDIVNIKNSAHCSMETNPDEFNDLLLDFIK